MVKHTPEDIYTYYYLNQAGSGFSNVYSGPVYQKGYGIGSFLGGLFRSLLPLLKNGTSVLGSELLKTGANIITDITHNEDPQNVIKRRGKETIDNLGKMVGNAMFGCGYNRAVGLKRAHSQTSSAVGKKRPVKRVKKEAKSKKKTKTKAKAKPKQPRRKNTRTKNDVLDIFS